MTADDKRRGLGDEDEAKVDRLIAEGVFDENLPADYRAVVGGLTPDEVEVISSINKRFELVHQLNPEDPGIENFGHF
jgi:hypothetical protein